MLVVREIQIRNKGRIVWECLCECGRYKNVTGHDLKSGGTKSCGCNRHCKHSKKHISNNNLEFNNVVKFCVTCNKQLKLRSERDIKRKNFCSRSCSSSYYNKSNLGYKHTEETKAKLRKPHIFKNKNQWLINLKKGHEHVVGTFKNHTNNHSSWGKRTRFNDITFRSTWEAYLAKLLLERNIKYIYEPKRFDLGKITFLPDFYLPDYNLYIEVKGYMDERSKRRIDLFRSIYPDENLILFTLKSIRDSGMSQWKVWKLFSESEVKLSQVYL